MGTDGKGDYPCRTLSFCTRRIPIVSSGGMDRSEGVCRIDVSREIVPNGGKRPAFPSSVYPMPTSCASIKEGCDTALFPVFLYLFSLFRFRFSSDRFLSLVSLPLGRTFYHGWGRSGFSSFASGFEKKCSRKRSISVLPVCALHNRIW